uniref:Netrin receptor UNC5 n=1 Tax=Saccoglossus kowalevskii TaxID=10224 RepID=A0ABM0MM98_SACKO|nr:PREDICTED: uncharacterized protein LOC102808619 [Saccoglossus kowalevskii]
MNNIDLEREDQDIIKDVLDLCQDYGQQLTMDKLTLNYLYKQGEAVPEKSRLMESRQITSDLSCNPISSNAIPLKCQLPIPKSHQVQTWINNGSQYKEASLRNTPSSEKFRMYTRPPTPDSGVSDVSPVSSPVCTPTSSSCINPLQTSQSKNDVHRYRPMPAFIDKNKHVLMNETHRRTFKSVPIFDQQIQRTQGSNYDTQILDCSCSMYSYEPIPRKPWSDCIHKQELLETEFGQCKHARSWGKGQVRYRGEFSPLDDEYEAKIQRYGDLTKFIIEPFSSKIYKDVSKHERAVQRQTMGMEEAFIMSESGPKKRTRSQKKRPVSGQSEFHFVSLDDDSVSKSQRREKQIEIPHCKAETFSSQPKEEVDSSSQSNAEVGFSSPPKQEVGFSSQPKEKVGFSSPPNEEVGFSRPPNEEVAASSPEMATQSQVLPILIKDPMLPSESVMRKNYVSGIFDHSGGHLLLMEMKVKLFIPPGAIPKDVEQEIFIYVSWENQHQLKCPKPKTSAGPIIICGPNGLKFRERVCLTFNHCFESAGEKWKLSPVYTATDIDKPSNYQPLIDPNKELSEQTSTCLLDVCNGKQRVTILVSHFTGFGLMAEPVQLNALSIADAEMDPAPPNVQGLGVAGARIDPVNPNGLGPGEAKAKMDLVLPNGEGACVAETDMDLAPSNGPITVHVGLDKQWMYTMVYLSMQTDIQLRVYVVKQIPGAEQWVEHEERKLSNPGMKCDATKQLAFYPNKKGIMVNLVNFETGWELYPSQEDPQRVSILLHSAWCWQ